MKHDFTAIPTGSTNYQAKIYFKTTTDSDFTEAHSVTINNIGKSSGGKYNNYSIDMTAVSGWSDSIVQIEIVPIVGNGTFEITNIEISNPNVVVPTVRIPTILFPVSTQIIR